MASKLLNLVALSSLAILAVSFGPTSTNALSTGHVHLNRHADHIPIAKKKRESKRCRVRPSTSVAAPTTTKKPAESTSTSAPPKQEQPAPTKSVDPPASTSPPKSSGGAPGNGKFGQKGSKICAAWGDGNDVATLKAFKTDHVVGLYNWSPFPPGAAKEIGYDFWPMLWSGGDKKAQDFRQQTSGARLGSIALGHNEPNEKGQANTDPATAAAQWKELMEPLREKGYKLASPAMSSRPNGQKWMADFMEACTGCNVEYQAVHWYDTSFDKFKKYITDYHNQLGLPMLITEFADQNFNGNDQATMSEIFAFMDQALKFIDETDWILAACPFGVMQDLQGVNELNKLQGPDGRPTDLGYMVINNAHS